MSKVVKILIERLLNEENGYNIPTAYNWTGKRPKHHFKKKSKIIKK